MIERSQIRLALTIVIGAAFLISLLAVIYIALYPPQVTDPYTEFYILGPDGNASSYPTNLSVGESGTVIVGLVNHEGTSMTYSIEVTANNKTIDTLEVTLAEEEIWEQRLTFSLSEPGRTRVRFLMYKGTDPSSAEPDEFLRLWVSVSSRS